MFAMLMLQGVLLNDASAAQPALTFRRPCLTRLTLLSPVCRPRRQAFRPLCVLAVLPSLLAIWPVSRSVLRSLLSFMSMKVGYDPISCVCFLSAASKAKWAAWEFSNAFSNTPCPQRPATFKPVPTSISGASKAFSSKRINCFDELMPSGPAPGWPVPPSCMSHVWLMHIASGLSSGLNCLTKLRLMASNLPSRLQAAPSAVKCAKPAPFW